ncbi:hypothetical protein [Streptomyces sp. NBC_01197]|uniref:hypothetical protein n=1 Tax=Streptomyces sp. NBC_01197 TaxID=2903768 RepID=UPI002E0FB037|nr:hypothetical protein OG452_08775 [Streptomyces sp. NBC_01197]
MTTRRTRRTARSAGLVAVAAAAAFSLTACQSGGEDAAGPEKKDSVSIADSTGNGAAHSDSRTSAEKTSADKTGADNSQTTARTRTTTETTASPIHTQPLPDGSTAKIYQVGPQHYLAKLVHKGEVFATLETPEQDADAGLDANDMFVVLTLGGEVHAWMGGGHQGPGTFKLAGGWKTKVTKLGEGKYRAQIIGHDGVDATLNANQHDTGVDANGIYIVLSSGGVISAHA